MGWRRHSMGEAAGKDRQTSMIGGGVIGMQEVTEESMEESGAVTVDEETMKAGRSSG
ncbi:hypothetical protein PHLCEN_2v4106 [Hermanssonia centrifuga]|uniref:Uncharacterized protein n=1 Tax=Hermanssonia centrifuga TaxID=98765 RepID=A0A2R6Q2B2_9APHY|nr:hypothetical protein PHLCEN_2v4106 [Hermanssonia centrifuga]